MSFEELNARITRMSWRNLIFYSVVLALLTVNTCSIRIQVNDQQKQINDLKPAEKEPAK